MNLEWTELATVQLTAVRDYLTGSSPGYAQVLAERIVQRTEALVKMPLLGAEVPEYGEETLREDYEHPYRILYRVTGEQLQVVAVIHSARRLPHPPPA